MNNQTNKIDCDVCSCKHNEEGKSCRLDNVKITCNHGACTCCGSFCNKQDEDY